MIMPYLSSMILMWGSSPGAPLSPYRMRPGFFFELFHHMRHEEHAGLFLDEKKWRSVFTNDLR